jgi:hypothetical protein
VFYPGLKKVKLSVKRVIYWFAYEFFELWQWHQGKSEDDLNILPHCLRLAGIFTGYFPLLESNPGGGDLLQMTDGMILYGPSEQSEICAKMVGNKKIIKILSLWIW